MARIIVIEDELQLQEIYKCFLEEDGHEVMLPKTENEYLEAVAQQKVDLIITDIIMPELDGIAVIKNMQTLPNSPPVIAISGGGQYVQGESLLSLAKQLGANSILQKPFNRDELIRDVARVLFAKSGDDKVEKKAIN